MTSKGVDAVARYRVASRVRENRAAESETYSGADIAWMHDDLRNRHKATIKGIEVWVRTTRGRKYDRFELLINGQSVWSGEGTDLDVYNGAGGTFEAFVLNALQNAGIHRASRAQENPRGPANDKTVAFLEDSTDAQRRAYAEKRLKRLAAGGGMNVLDSYSVVRVRENPRRENPIDGTDRSDTFNVVEYAVRDLFKGKSIRSVARATAKKFSGFENYLLGPGVTIIDPVALEAALWNRMAEYAVAAIPKLRVGKEHFALGGTLQFYRQAQTSDARAKLKSLVVEKLGSDPFTSDDGT